MTVHQKLKNMYTDENLLYVMSEKIQYYFKYNTTRE